MDDKILLSTAYLPPVGYFMLIQGAGEIFIEKEENYTRQTYRNRCKILSSGGPLVLSVPVKKGGEPKAKIKDVEIDYTKRWQSIHLRALTASYNSAPWFRFYFEKIERIINSGPRLLIDLNTDLLFTMLEFLKMRKTIGFTSTFEPASDARNDYRYRLSPKKEPDFGSREYIQVFNYRTGFVPGLSIIDLLFNMGPDSSEYLYAK
ncbi:MAG: WbqC family protein [Bacteroidales bacterium]|nr:WbqC family protein [Bacteroidales bacterium]